MPGRLVMDQHAVQGPDGLKKHSTSVAAHATQTTQTTQTNGNHLSPPLNGTDFADFAPDPDNAARLNNNDSGFKPALVNGSRPAYTEGSKDGAHPTDSPDGSPPDLEDWSHTYVPMSVLYPRIAEACHSDLVEMIETLAGMAVQQPPSAVNGASNHDSALATVDRSASSRGKKITLMEFAHEQRNRFIKLLVLLDWSRKMPDMNSLIQLRMWLSNQEGGATAVANAVVQLKHNMIPAKMPNPNIRGALELLSTGKAPWMPDMGYIPPKRLSPAQLLRTLKDMNFLMSVRLNVHEELPYQFRDYAVANGRATFVVPDEFELDLALADEDPQSPFYFIDMRFLFSSSRQIPEGAVRRAMEAKVNDVLATEGLSGCYLYLHDFVLTHRINLLRRQAFEMARKKWSECIRVETVHRDFIVHYWTGRPGPKSWIHVGTLSSAKPPSLSQLSLSSRTGIRWMRDGQDTMIMGSEIDSPHHSMEHVLEQIITSHRNQRLHAVADRVQALSGRDSILTVEVKEAGEASGAQTLEIRFGASRVSLNLGISTVTGRFSITPATTITMDAERRINSDPSLDVGQVIIALHSKVLQTQIGKLAHRLEWTRLPIGKHDDIYKIFGGDVLRWSVFAPKKWGSAWAIALTISLSGEKWWVVKFGTSALPSRSILSAELMPSVATLSSSHPIPLIHIESKSVAQISFSNITYQLRQRKIQYELRQVRAASQKVPPTAFTGLVTTVLCINFNDLMRPTDPQVSKSWRPWCREAMLLTHHGLSDASSEGDAKMIHVVKVPLSSEATVSLAKADNIIDGKDVQISFSDRGACALQLRTDFEENLVASIKTRLKRVERLYNYIRVAQRSKMSLEHTSVTRIVFKYQAEPALLAELRFTEDATSSVQVRLTAAGQGQPVNPHRRVQPFLQKLMAPENTNESADAVQESNRFARLLHMMSATLPLLRGIASLENADQTITAIRGTAYALTHYRLTYAQPFANVVFDITLRKYGGKTAWLVNVPSDKPIHDTELMKALRKLWSDKGDGWFGLTTGAYAEPSSIEKLLARIDDAVRETGKTETDQASGDKDKTAAREREIVVLD